MPHISPLAHADTTGDVKTTLDTIKTRIGMVPNLYATLAKAPAALNGLLALGGALEKGQLSKPEAELIALIVGQLNDCSYCVSAHSMIAKGAGISPADILAARAGTLTGGRNGAIVALAKAIVTKKGHVSRSDIEAAKAGGLSEAEVLEVTAHVVKNIFTNYANHVADTEVDFPKVDLKLTA